jgi:branched-chain amino acid transport system ATP-binding protein
MNAKILEVKALGVRFGGLQALLHVDLDVPERSIFGVIGPNGAGKTTFFNVISGFIRPSEGAVIFSGQDITACEAHVAARKGIVRTFQITSVFPDLTVEENISIGRHLHRRGDGLRALGLDLWETAEARRNRDLVHEIATFLGIEDMLDQLAKNASFGVQRKLEIGIALAAEPRLLLLDEPAAGMNLEEAMSLVDLMESIRQRGTTILIVEHNIKVVVKVCDRIAVLNYGEKIAEGAPEEILQSDNVRRVYLGEGESDV